ncbi:expressed unknown protein [Seminavis robusta]|uniref:Hydroxylase n=1 Tax=Seminavis robusta TaxID=568900 RepID=A0A9N8ECP4_9STRA|nr:expressed unknown protein [Seminavis robusta]|eukprot:Sro954_g224320.1 n/a (117) ;mRNA; f:21731-22081
MKIEYLEMVTPDVDALCKIQATIHGIEFGDPVPNLGNARTAKMANGGVIGIRGPMRPDESPVTRSYMLVQDLPKAMAAAKEVGAEIAIESMDLPGHGKIGMFIQGGIECGLWQNES